MQTIVGRNKFEKRCDKQKQLKLINTRVLLKTAKRRTTLSKRKDKFRHFDDDCTHGTIISMISKWFFFS